MGKSHDTTRLGGNFSGPRGSEGALKWDLYGKRIVENLGPEARILND